MNLWKVVCAGRLDKLFATKTKADELARRIAMEEGRQCYVVEVADGVSTERAVASPYTFWLVWNPDNTRSPCYRHDTEASATEEARRLAQANRGQQFYVLRACGFSHLEPVPFVQLEDAPEMPF